MILARVIALVGLVAAGLLFAASLPDIVRYLRMRSM